MIVTICLLIVVSHGAVASLLSSSSLAADSLSDITSTSSSSSNRAVLTEGESAETEVAAVDGEENIHLNKAVEKRANFWKRAGSRFWKRPAEMTEDENAAFWTRGQGQANFWKRQASGGSSSSWKRAGDDKTEKMRRLEQVQVMGGTRIRPSSHTALLPSSGSKARRTAFSARFNPTGW